MASNELSTSMSRKSFYEHEESVKSNQMASKKLSNSSDGKEQIEDMDEKELKHLLDEAITFRNPRDANEKSETFKRLLQNVTDEDERARNTGLNPFFKAQSNSLQNLIDDSNFNQSSHQSHTSSKKHQQRRKNSTSVSTRRLEGGSLPVDMHHSSAIQSPPDQPFLSELKNNKKRQKEKQAKETVIDIPDNETDERKYQRNEKDKDSYLEHGIEMKTFSTHHLMDDHNISKYTSASSAQNTITTMASMTGSPISTSMITSKSSTASSMTSVDSSLRLPLNCSGGEKYHTKDKLISYQQAQSAEIITCPGSTINHSNHILLAGGPGPNYGSTSSGGKIEPTIPLPAGAGISSVMDAKSSFGYNSSSNKRQPSREDIHAPTLQTTPQLSLSTNPQASTNTVSGGSVNASSSSKDPKAKKRAAKSERNEKTIDVQSIEGFCGHETVEALLSYIDGDKGGNSGNQKNHPKNGLLSTQLLNSDEKKKKMVAKNKEKVNKLKKSNSMDELCSTGRQQQVKEDEKVTANKIAQDTSTVTLRSKSSITKKSLESKDGKENKQQSKRNERRSWGTEGLSSWPDSTAPATTQLTNVILTNNYEESLQNEQETSSSSSSSGVQLDIHENNPTNNITTIISNISSQTEMSTISAEAEKFQLVSKKRKVKRKSSEAPEFKTSTTSTFSTTTPVVNNNLYNSTMSRGGRGNTNEGSQSSAARTDFRGTKHNTENAPRNKKPMSQQDAKQTQNSTQSQQPSQQQQQNAKNRRKSTSSMPHSDEEYSDGGDSVQSLPIETTKTTSSLLSAPQQIAAAATNNNPPLPTPPTLLTSAENKTSSKKNPIEHKQLQLAPQQQVVQQTLQKPTTISYADIAKTSSIRQNNNNNLGTTNAASTEKWPSISSSSSSHQQQPQQNINVVSDPFALSNFDASNINNNQQAVKQPKVTAASISTSALSFPDLVESNNNRNKQLSSSNDAHQIAPITVSVATSTTLNGDALQTELNGGGVGGMVFICDTTSIDPDRINNNNKISYSQSLLESNNDLDANGNAQKTTETSKNVLIKSKSVDHNNLSSIEHYPALEKTKQTLSEVLSKPIESLTTKGKQKQITKSIATTVAPFTIVDDGKVKKKAQKKNVSTSTSPPTQSQNQNFIPNSQHSNHNHNHHPQRPAVIILNDNASYENTNELGITFGFDIDEHLLCGYQNGDAIMIEESSSRNNANNNNNCDIMNTNLSSNTNLSNNQSCGIEFEDFYAPVATHATAIIHTSSPEQSNNINEMSADLGYISTASMILTNTMQSPQITFCENGPNERDFGLQVTPLEIQQMTTKFEQVFVPASLPEFISPQITTKSYNYEEIVAFVSEEWTKAQRNGIFFNGQ